jgi:hypothetical protein
LTPLRGTPYIPAVRRATVAVLLISLAVSAAGCGTRPPVPRSPTDAQLFAPVSMRVHPIFSDLKDWNGDGQIDGIEALLEFQDQFNDPTKAAGTVVFELFTYRPYNPDPRGQRVVNPWVGSLQTLPEQQARWNRTSRTYSFQLEYPQVRADENYVLTATFDTGTTRFFDEVILQGENAPRARPAAATPAPATSVGAPAATVTTMPAAATPVPPVTPTTQPTPAVSPRSNDVSTPRP